MMKALFWLCGLWWGLPVATFALTAVLTGKPHIFLAMLCLAVASILCGALFGLIAGHIGRDQFEGVITGALAGLLLSAWPIGAYFL